jgi:hypothetical protein
MKLGMKIKAAFAITALALPVALRAESPAVFKVISPIFSQLVTFSIPSNFVAVFENTSGGNYTRKAVLKGETAERWTQMITVTGAEGLANSPNATPEKFASTIAGGFRQVCPDGFAAKSLGETRFGNAIGFVAVVGCGSVENHSETALIAVVKGASDYYIIQWAERGAAADLPPVEDARWTERLRMLQPIGVCAIVAGEAAPYPSCVGKNP